MAGMGAEPVWPGERKGDTSLIFLCPSVRSGLCSSQSKGEDEDVVLHRDCVSVCVCVCADISLVCFLSGQVCVHKSLLRSSKYSKRKAAAMLTKILEITGCSEDQ